MKSRFYFCDIVIVRSEKNDLLLFNGREGVIRGGSQSEEDPSVFAYSVDFYDEKNEMSICKFIFEEDLQGTGKKFDKNKMYTDARVKVRVDPKTGEGEIVDGDD